MYTVHLGHIKNQARVECIHLTLQLGQATDPEIKLKTVIVEQVEVCIAYLYENFDQK